MQNDWPAPGDLGLRVHHHHHGSRPAMGGSAAPMQSGGGMGGGLMGAVATGMAMGTGSAIAHTAINSMMGGGSHAQAP